MVQALHLSWAEYTGPWPWQNTEVGIGIAAWHVWLLAAIYWLFVPQRSSSIASSIEIEVPLPTCGAVILTEPAQLCNLGGTKVIGCLLACCDACREASKHADGHR